MALVSVPLLIPVHHQPIPSFYGEWWALLLGTIAMIAITRLKPFEMLLPQVALVPVGLLILTGLQWSLGMVPTREALFMHGGYLVWAALLIAFGAVLARTLGSHWVFNTLAWGLIFGSLASALLALSQLLNLPLPAYILFPWFMPETHAGIFANIAQSNLLGSYVWMGIAATLHLHNRNLLARVSALLSVIVLGFIAGLTLSRMSIMFGVAMLAMPFVLAQYPPARKIRSRLVIVALLSLMAGGMVLHQWSHQSKRVASVTLLDRYAPKSVGADPRLDIWRDTVHVIGKHPWLGNGIGNYTWAMLESTAEAPANAKTLPNAEHSHNLFLQLAADYGLPALLVFLWLFGRWLKGMHAARVASNQGLFGFDLLAVLFIYSMLEYPLWYAFYLGLAALVIGVSSASLELTKFDGSPRLLRFGLLAAILALLPVRLDFGTLDFAVSSPLSNTASDQAAIAELQQRVDMVASIGTHSSIESYAGIVLTILSVPERKFAHEQSRLCEDAMKIWPIPIIVTRCAVLRELTARPQEAEQLLVLLDKAYRTAGQKREVGVVLDQAKTKNPETERLRAFWYSIRQKTAESADANRSE